MTKKCTSCGLIKCIDEFYKRSSSRNGLHSMCKLCSNAYGRARRRIPEARQKMREYEKRRNKTEARKNQVKRRCIEQASSIKKYYQIKGQTVRGRYARYKGTAKHRNIEFNLSFLEFMKLWQKNCHYCNSEIKTIGLDRIDNTKGYTVNNIVSCCTYCNKMKLDRTTEQFIQHVEKIYLLKVERFNERMVQRA